ncbi:GntR family transcriptional regulator [Aquamicrobium sp. LC103]|uniref:GntR family transcriptional regulator n=1 Tax=Aquamicrobium sp. LC103 TaxID=1120658 RepID=UPI00063EA1FD|nr:GntR family transcriptional regulator [Aquamicrobium sp. LC103]TKT69594.1 GntR family transcriptional regulator [Aquamicrobium sp. LC103]
MNGSSNLARNARRRIIDMILNGTLKPGDALQEAALGDILGMSRTPVREAIKRIESEGLAVSAGRFIRVRHLTPAEIEEIFFLRLQLEPISARAAIRLPAPLIDGMEARIRTLMTDGPDGDDLQWRIDDDLHAMLARAAGNRTTESVIAGLRNRTCVFDHNQVPERFLKGCEEHLEILAAIRSGDADAVETAVARHLEHARDAVLARLQQLQSQSKPES